MTKIEEVLQLIGSTRIISILRGIEVDTSKSVIKALQEGGIRALEVTMNTPSALSVIEQAQDIESITVGAGTVLDLQMAKDSISAGAKFVLSPSMDVRVIEYCISRDVLPIPGVFTPTELYTAYCAGAEVFKIFPAGSVGPQYIKDLLGPFKGKKLIPVGGVSLENTAQFINAGAFAVGVGSYLANEELARQGCWEAITERARLFIEQASKR